MSRYGCEAMDIEEMKEWGKKWYKCCDCQREIREEETIFDVRDANHEVELCEDCAKDDEPISLQEQVKEIK